MSDANSQRAVAYLRVSSISQVDGHSLNAQDRLFNQLCESRGWAAVRVYREEAAFELGIGYATLKRLIDAQESAG